MPMLKLVGGPEDGSLLACEREPDLLLCGLPPDPKEQHPDHVIRAAYLRQATGEYHFIGYKSRHEAQVEHRYTGEEF